MRLTRGPISTMSLASRADRRQNLLAEPVDPLGLLVRLGSARGSSTNTLSSAPKPMDGI